MPNKTASSTEPTAEALTALRDQQQLSWAKVAEAVGLGSPGAARRAYSALVRPHTESVLPTRFAGEGKGKGLQPVDLTGLGKDQVGEVIAGRTIVVQRKDRTEEIHVARVTSVKGDAINFNDSNKSRTVKASTVVAVR